MDLRRYQGIKNRLSYYCKRDLTAIAARVVLERGWLAATLTGKTENRKVRRFGYAEGQPHCARRAQPQSTWVGATESEVMYGVML